MHAPTLNFIIFLYAIFFINIFPTIAIDKFTFMKQLNLIYPFFDFSAKCSLNKYLYLYIIWILLFGPLNIKGNIRQAGNKIHRSKILTIEHGPTYI